MKITEDLNDQVLGAFIDGQLDAETSESIINAMDENTDVRERVYNLRRTKDLMKLGFSQACMSSNTHNKSKSSRWKQWNGYVMALAASITAVSIAVGSGVFGYHFGKQGQFAFNDINPESITLQQKSDRVLLHINESDMKHFAVALDYAEKFLEEHEAKGGQIAVVANAGGLDLMRTGVSPYEQQVRNMMAKHENVYFIACANSIRHLREQGIQPKLIENVRVEKPALDHIIDYVQKGWSYKRVQSLVKI